MGFLTRLFDADGFPPRWLCGQGWTDDPYLGWLHIGSDIATWIAYLAIPCVLAYFVLKRRELAFPNVFWLFCVFILSCGTVHLIEVIIFWVPLYRLSAVVKLVTALVSTATVIALIRILPEAIELPGLAEINATLQREVDERRNTETQLQASNHELQEFTDAVLDREDRVLQLKSEVNQLLQELGRGSRYVVEP